MRRLRPTVALVLALAGAGLAACGSSSSGTGAAPAVNPAAPPPTRQPVEVTLALDWTPNTNHTGFFVADRLGYYADAGITLKILPYNSTSPDILVSAGKADFGISFQDGYSFSKAAGLRITSVASIVQQTITDIVVRSDSGITSPAQLDGKVYAGFGGPSEVPTMATVIRNAGGKGDFTSVTLNTFAYDAVYGGKADFAQAFRTWEVIEAKLKGKPVSTFPLTRYGLPDRYDVILIGGEDWLGANTDLARRFVHATTKGFEYAAREPDRAAQILIDANPGAFNEPQLVKQSAELLAKDFYLDPAGRFGTQTAAKWKGYTDFLFANGLLVDGSGTKLTTEPDSATWFTDKYLTGP